jgi:hypothetical protein
LFCGRLSVYATVATLGLLTRAGVALPPSLHLVGSWPVIALCAVMFVFEFFADKIPTFDLIWNALLARTPSWRPPSPWSSWWGSYLSFASQFAPCASPLSRRGTGTCRLRAIA